MHRITRAVIGSIGISLARNFLLAVGAGLSYAAWRRIDITSASLVTLTAVVAVLSSLPWLRGAGLRATRFAAGGLTGIAGFLLTLQLSLMAGPNGIGDTRGATTGWMTIAVGFAVLGGLLCDERTARHEAAEQRQRDELAARRHSEFMQVVRRHRRGRSTASRPRFERSTIQLGRSHGTR